jgi:hypothetical protein
MSEAKQGRCARQGIKDARRKAGRMREARQGKADLQEKTDARCKARQMPEAKQGECETQGRADARDKAGLMREAREAIIMDRYGGPQTALNIALHGGLYLAVIEGPKHAYYSLALRRLISHNNGPLWRAPNCP